MNNLILIGNGFDLAHGLKTSYAHFILWYLNKIREEIVPHQKYNDPLLSIESSPREIQVNKFDSIVDALKYFDSHHYKFNFKYDLIKRLVEDMASDNWVDIEYFYYSLLVSIYRDYERNLPKYETDLKASAKSLNNCFAAIVKLLNDYLSTIKISSKHRNLSISQHLKAIVNPGNPDVQYAKTPNTLILNFNYTTTVDLYSVELGLEKNLTKIINIHGSINSLKNPIIFGYGDEMNPFYPHLENLNINSFLDHIKSFHYLKTTNYLQLMRFVEADPFVIYIMGHSCGLSDRVLLNSIFEHDKCSNIKIYYHDRKDGSNDYFEKTQEISRHFKPENKAMMRKQIVPFEKCSPLT